MIVKLLPLKRFIFRLLTNAVVHFTHDLRVRRGRAVIITFVGRDGRSYAITELQHAPHAMRRNEGWRTVNALPF